jgi:hypothetical protein
MQTIKRIKRLALSIFVGIAVFLALHDTALAQTIGDAADAAGENALTKVTGLVFEILIVVLPLFASWLAHRLIKVFESKTKIDVPEMIEGKIDKWIEQGIHLAAEKGYKTAKVKAAKLTGPEKLEIAAAFAWNMAQSQGYIDWTKDKIESKVEAALGVHRANGGVPKLEAGAGTEAGTETGTETG